MSAAAAAVQTHDGAGSASPVICLYGKGVARGYAIGRAVVMGAAALEVDVYKRQVCYYCACNKVVTRHHDRAARYLDALAREIALHVAELGPDVPVSQLHFGGGTPTFLSDEELDRLMADLRGAFRFEPDAEISIEVDPRTATPQRLERLRKLGFNRLSFGVQDFDPKVQVAVHRVQSFEDVRDLMQSARALGYASINVDLIYGLPLQTTESLDVYKRQAPGRTATIRSGWR